MNLAGTKKKYLKKLIKENIFTLHQYFSKKGRYKFVKNMQIELFKEQLIQWVFNVRNYMKRYNNSRFEVEEILGEFVKIENLKNKYHIQ